MSISQVLVILLRRGWIVLLALLTTMIVAGSAALLRRDHPSLAELDGVGGIRSPPLLFSGRVRA